MNARRRTPDVPAALISALGAGEAPEAVRAALEQLLAEAETDRALLLSLPPDETFLLSYPVEEDEPVAPLRRTGLAEVRVAASAAEAYDVRPKLANAIEALGNNAVADLLGVSRSQPGRWARGEEGISAVNQSAVIELDFVLAKLLQSMPAELAGIWLVSPNTHLGGARPIDVFLIDGHSRVVDAIRAYDEDAYA